MSRVRKRFVIAGVLVAVLVAGAAWWWIGSRSDPEPQPLSVSCEDAPPPDRESDAPDMLLPSAPSAIAGEPVQAPAEPSRFFDYVSPSQRYQDGALGYQLDYEAASVSYVRERGEPVTPEWTRTLYSGPLVVGATLRELPGSDGLLQVVGEPQDADADLLVAAVDAAGAFHMSCVVASVPPSDELMPATLTPDGEVLLVPNVDEEGEEWVEAHATGGEHLWSAPAVAAVADDRHVFLATSTTLSARETLSGEVEWEEEIDTSFDDRPGSEPTASGWDLAVVDDELYAYRHGAPRLVAVDTRDGQVTWDLAKASEGPASMRITPLDDDHRVLVQLGNDLAVRAPSASNWWWLHRGVDNVRVTDVLARDGAPTLVALEPDDDRFVVMADDGELLADLALSRFDYKVAVADTMVYALHDDDGTVTGFDLERGEAVWTVPVVTDDDSQARGIRATEGGFLVNVGGAYIPFHGQ